MHMYMCHFHHAQKLILHTRSASGAVALWMSAAIVDSTEGILLVPYVFLLPIAHTQAKRIQRRKALVKDP
jgi:hypothetical protein